MVDVLIWYFAIFLIGILAAPIGLYLFGKLDDYAYPFYRIIGLGFVSYLVWILASLKVMPFSVTSVIVSAIILTFISSLLVHYKKVSAPKDFFKKALIYEALFAGFFISFLAYRMYHSNISDIEKFMDFAFLNTLLRADYFPPQDPWLAGHPINYYYFGHLIAAVMAKVTAIKSGVIFNLMVVTNYVFFVAGIFSIAYNLTKKYAWSFLAIIIAAFMGNISYFFRLIFGGQETIWWADATRIIPGTINEFPLYSFLLGDMHAHYLGLPFVLLTILSLFIVLKTEPNWPFKIFLGLLFSILFITNSWDYLIYAFFLTVVLIYKNGLKWDGFLKSLSFGLSVSSISILGLLLFYLNFEPGTQGIKFVTAPRTKIPDFLLLFSLQYFAIVFYVGWQFYKNIAKKKNFILSFILITVVGLVSLKNAPLLLPLFIPLFLLLVIMDEKKNSTKSESFGYLLILMSLILITFCEFFYLKDIYDIEFQRANTIFKVYYQVWLFLSLIVVLVAKYFWESTEWAKNLFFFIAIPLFSFSIYYLPNNISVSADGFSSLIGLDGTKYLAEKYPEDFKAITWLNKNVKGQAVIAEKPGESYTDDSRVSAYTGLITPLGWLGHQWGWHGSLEGLPEIKKDIDDFYITNDYVLARNIINKYKIDYIFIGELEKTAYVSINYTMLESLGEVVFLDSEVEIIKVKR